MRDGLRLRGRGEAHLLRLFKVEILRQAYPMLEAILVLLILVESVPGLLRHGG